MPPISINEAMPHKNKIMNKKTRTYQNKKLNLTFLTGIAIAALGIAISCSKKNEGTTPEIEISQEASTNMKEIVIFDSTMENSIELRITANDKLLLESFSEKSFELITNPVYDEVFIEDEYLKTDGLEEDSTKVENLAEFECPIKIEYMNLNFKNDVKEYEVIYNFLKTSKDGDNGGKGCDWRWEYGFVNQHSYASCVRTRNVSGRRCNDLLISVYSTYPKTLISRYYSRHKYGMTWTCMPSTNPKGIYVQCDSQKHGACSFLYTVN